VITDEELTALALAAEPDPVLPDDAVALWDLVGADETLVSSWYMPAPTAHRSAIRGWRRRMILFLVGVFVLFEAVGLCSAYGSIVIG
jgi:hypothetical protein